MLRTALAICSSLVYLLAYIVVEPQEVKDWNAGRLQEILHITWESTTSRTFENLSIHDLPVIK
jgi:hypothetical protein